MKFKAVKKAFAMTLACAMTLGMFGTAAMAEEWTPSPELDLSEEVNLTLYVVSDRPAGQDVVDEHLNEILKEKLNATITISWIGWAEYQNKYPLLFTSGEKFDLAYSATWLNYPSLALRGAFKSLGSDEEAGLWETYAPNNWARQSDAAKYEATVGDGYYCVPTLLSTYNAYGPIYRTEFPDQGLTWEGGALDSFEKIEEYGDWILENIPGMEPIDVYSTQPEWLMMWMQNQGYTWVQKGTMYLWFDPTEENPQIVTPYEVDGIKDFLEMMARWGEKGFFSKSALADTDSQKPTSGKAALRVHNIDTYSGWVASYPEMGWAYTNLVADVAHLPYTQDCIVVSNTSQNPERAMAFIDLITSDQEAYDALMYGVEGISYTLNDEGQFKITDADLYQEGALWAARTDGISRQQDGTPADWYSDREEWEETIVPGENSEKYAAFTFDTTPVETQYASCASIQQQYWWPLELGYTDLESGLAQYQQMMEAGGIETVREEAQAQLDAYVASLAE